VTVFTALSSTARIFRQQGQLPGVVPVPCGYDGEISSKLGNWPVAAEERGWDTKYSIPRGILAFLRMSSAVETGAA